MSFDGATASEPIASETALSVSAVQLPPAGFAGSPLHFQMPPWAPASRIVPSFRTASAPIRPLIAPKCWVPGLRRPWMIGFGPIPAHGALNVVGPLGAYPRPNDFAVHAASARSA